MKNIWSQSIAIPIGVAIVVGAAIVGIGEAYLTLGDFAIFLAIVLMFGIVAVAALYSQQAEREPETKPFLGESIWRQSFFIPIAVAIVVGAGIVAIGESYLSLGDAAIYLAIVLMFGIVAVAAYLSRESEFED
ncbi:MAG: hypothetical protein WBW04_13940 [Nitrolancea sp.]